MLKLSPVAFAVLSALALPTFAVAADDVTQLESVVVTAPASKKPLTVKLNPKAPQQPLPAQDGAAFLKTIPGMSVIRKGGTDGDPMFRGMAGSRLGMLIDGHEVYGGCGMRMDPPTAYIHPESFDKVTLQKGPTVKYGAGFSAGVVNFEHDSEKLAQAGSTGHASVTLGSAGRNDVELEGKTGTEKFFIHGSGTHADANDYKDGDGKTVHSAYTRWNTSADMGWTPDADTLVKLSVGKSDGKAAYADRTMDGVKFDRENAELKFERKNVSPLVDKVEGEIYHSYVDHIMDNYSLRTKTAANFMINNPDRTTDGARAAITLNASDKTKVTLGADTKRDVHTLRTGSNANLATALTQANGARPEDMRFEQTGIFGEVKHFMTDDRRVIGGLRVDQHKAKDSRSTSITNGMTDKDTLKSGFVRYEKDVADGRGTYYAGLGHTERYPDYWEIVKADPVTSTSALLTVKPEKNNQLDVGMNWKAGKWSGSTSTFYNKIDDYLLVDARTATTKIRNVKAETYGFEADAAYQISDNWKGTAGLSFVHGDNKTDHKPLAQQPAHELKLGAEYDNKKQFFGAQLRLVSAQDRVDLGEGNIVGQDISKTSGFGVFSVNGGTRPKKGVLLSAGVDNLFDKKYAEHISRTGSATVIPGYEQTVKLNEPGRTLWVKATFDLD
jgi:iron complex outermembrane receptor protein